VPFTFAHPAAAVPLLRPLGRRGSLSALVIGSIAPDLAFIVPLEVTRAQTHGLAGLLLFCLPAGMLAYLLFHLVLKAPLLDLFPERLREALAAAAGRPRALWSAVPVSLLCGAATHVAWDSFTHPGAMVDAIPTLGVLLFSLGGYDVFVYKVLQHGGSVLGLALLAFWFRRWFRRSLRTAPDSPAPVPALPAALRRLWLAALVAGPLLVACWVAARRSPALTDLASLRTFAAAFIFTALPAMALALTAYSAGWHAWARLKFRSS
jgi:hypothetical protein